MFATGTYRFCNTFDDALDVAICETAIYKDYLVSATCDEIEGLIEGSDGGRFSNPIDRGWNEEIAGEGPVGC